MPDVNQRHSTVATTPKIFDRFTSSILIIINSYHLFTALKTKLRHNSNPTPGSGSALGPTIAGFLLITNRVVLLLAQSGRPSI